MHQALFGTMAIVMLAGLPHPGTVHAADLEVEIHNVRATGGRVLVSLFKQPDGFPRKGYWRGEAVAPASKTVSVVFRDIAAGTYAVAAFHDVDGNGKLNTNGLGIPIEPLAFSRNAASTPDGPPRFSDAEFRVADPKIRISMTLR